MFKDMRGHNNVKRLILIGQWRNIGLLKVRVQPGVLHHGLGLHKHFSRGINCMEVDRTLSEASKRNRQAPISDAAIKNPRVWLNPHKIYHNLRSYKGFTICGIQSKTTGGPRPFARNRVVAAG